MTKDKHSKRQSQNISCESDGYSLGVACGQTPDPDHYNSLENWLLSEAPYVLNNIEPTIHHGWLNNAQLDDIRIVKDKLNSAIVSGKLPKNELNGNIYINRNELIYLTESEGIVVPEWLNHSPKGKELKKLTKRNRDVKICDDFNKLATKHKTNGTYTNKLDIAKDLNKREDYKEFNLTPETIVRLTNTNN